MVASRDKAAADVGGWSHLPAAGPLDASNALPAGRPRIACLYVRLPQRGEVRVGQMDKVPPRVLTLDGSSVAFVPEMAVHGASGARSTGAFETDALRRVAHVSTADGAAMNGEEMR